jgi:hypothetical protein
MGASQILRQREVLTPFTVRRIVATLAGFVASTARIAAFVTTLRTIL